MLTDAGSAAAHRGWEPELEQLETLVSIIEHFVKHFTLNDDAGKLKQSIPPRDKRRTPNEGGEASQIIEFPASKNSSS